MEDTRPITKRSELIIPTCEDCGYNIEHGNIPCPDGLTMCCVAHHGMRCTNCGRQYANPFI